MPMWEVPAHQQAITSVALWQSPSATRVLTARYALCLGSGTGIFLALCTFSLDEMGSEV